ncbi:MAG: hypothetical protein IT453_09975 [Planctomycetes bacterium]|nr:hypothetical protein [Planctomycetota bacterium]
MAHASDAFLFGAALCLICAPALLSGKLDDFSDDAFEVHAARNAGHVIPAAKLTPATPIRPELPKDARGNPRLPKPGSTPFDGR